MSEYSFAITPGLFFEDTETTVLGESITLTNVAFDFSTFAGELANSAISISASILNNCVEYTTESGANFDISIDAVNDISVSDITISSEEYLLGHLRTIAENSLKGTIASILTGSVSGDIGMLETDPNLSGDVVFPDLDGFKTSIINAMHDLSGAAIGSMAENIFYNTDVSVNPFVAGDKLMFNMLFANGTITINLDTVDSSLTSGASVNGIAYYTGPDPISSLGLESSGIINDASASNVYFGTDITAATPTAGRTANLPFVLESGSTGYYAPAADETTAKGVMMMRFALLLV